ncbi:MAG: preprotein translocase subunit YajC, partial [bacterium]|nr:preprotein translocase subunit YajC [bacterium]
MDETTQAPEAPANVTSETVSEESATTTVPSDVNTAGGTQPRKSFGPINMIFIAVLIFFVFMMFRGPRKKQQQQRKMIKSLEKNDRIRTIGGIIGTVIEAKPEEITVKVDETNNVRMKFTRGAIHGVGSSAKYAKDDLFIESGTC